MSIKNPINLLDLELKEYKATSKEECRDLLIKGYKLLHGGNYNMEKNFFEPTIVEVKSIKDKILKDEIFGPILPVLTYQSVDDLKNILNEYNNPLAFYVFSNNISFAEDLISTNSFDESAF